MTSTNIRNINIFLLSLCTLLFPVFAFSQSKISGKLIDLQSKQSLAFVSILEKGTSNGTLTDIDGKFTLQLKSGAEQVTLICSYLGYVKKEVVVNVNAGEEIKIAMQNEGVNLNEVVIKPGVNPALRIIRKTAQNRDINNPEKMQSFSYNSYNKMFVTADLNANEDSVKAYDSTDKKGLQKFFAKQHLFLTESVSKRDFKKPDHNHEEVLASRVSGFKSAPFTLLATQMQSFSFYENWVNVMDIEYLNPISDNAINKYTYILEDTLYNKQDTVFIISFRPKKGKNFSGLTGVLYINTNTYAVQNVIAEPNNEDLSISIKIQQKYEYIEDKQWFPVQLNTDWIYKNISAKDSSGKTSAMKAISRSYIRDIKLNPEISKKEFSEVEVSIHKDADKKNEEFWQQYRIDSLDKKDKETYRTIDSIGKKENFDRKALAFEALLTGNIPVKFVNVRTTELMAYNDYEGYRLGLNAYTNNKISDIFSVGGYFAYGFKDKAWKYGGSAEVNIWKRRELKWEGIYKKDVLETGNINFGEKFTGIQNMEQARTLTITMKDKYELMQTGFSFRMLRYIKAQPYIAHETRISPVGYLRYNDGTPNVQDTFYINETGVKLKFLFKEKFMQTLRNRISLGSDYPVVYVNFMKGLNNNISSLKGNWDYTKVETKIDYTYRTGTYGKQNICLIAGRVYGNVPYTLTYNGLGNYLYSFGVVAAHCFETMYPNEFVSDRYAALFFSHNFGKFLKPNKKFNPEFEIVHNMGIGKCDNTSRFINFPYKTMDKGFFESGIKLNCLIKSGFSGIGVGAFYRYGPNAFSIPANNLVLKLTLAITMM